jgi:hypothetical protein
MLIDAKTGKIRLTPKELASLTYLTGVAPVGVETEAGLERFIEHQLQQYARPEPEARLLHAMLKDWLPGLKAKMNSPS